MTRYKKYLKEAKEMMFDEDYSFMPYDMTGGLLLESRDVFVCRDGLLVVAVYNVGVGRGLYLPNGKRLGIYEEDDYIEEIEFVDVEIRIYHDLPHYRFYYDEDDDLLAVRYMKEAYTV